MPPDEKATFVLETETDPGPVKEAAAALVSYKAAIDKSRGALGDYRKSLSMLKGSSDEVESGRKRLKALIENEKQKITENNLAILKLGSSYAKLDKFQKEHLAAVAKEKKAMAANELSLKNLGGRFGELSDFMEHASTGAGALALATTATAAAFAVFAAGVSALVAKFTEWVVTSGDMLRNLQLSREAFAGSEKNATAWGHQVDWARQKIALTTDQLSELTNETNKAFLNTRISGQGMVDVWKAVALAKGAGRDDTASKIMSIVDRAKLSGRGGIQQKGPGIDELQGTGLTRQKVALELATDLGVSYQRANVALAAGIVPATALAKALREASEAQFGLLNTKKMESLSGLWATLVDNVTNWASALAQADGPLAPLLADFKSIVDMTGLQSESGQQARAAVTQYALALSNLVHENLPAMKQMVTEAIALGSAFVQGAAAVIGFASSAEGMAAIKVTLIGIATVVGALAFAFAAVGVAVYGIVSAVGSLASAGIAIASDLRRAFSNAFDPKAIFDVKAWTSLGEDIVTGLIAGLTAMMPSLGNAVSAMGALVKRVFSGSLDMHSPSRVFQRFGRMTGTGYAMGVGDSQDDATGAVRSMGASASAAAVVASAQVADTGNAGSASPAASAPANINVKLEFNFAGAKDSQAAQAVQSQSFLDGLTHALQTALRSAGVPTGALVVTGG